MPFFNQTYMVLMLSLVGPLLPLISMSSKVFEWISNNFDSSGVDAKKKIFHTNLISSHLGKNFLLVEDDESVS